MSQAVELIGAVALVVAGVSALALRAHGRGFAGGRATSAVRAMSLPFTNWTVTAVFAIPLIIGSVCLANLVSILSSGTFSSLMVGANLGVLLGSFYAMAWMMRSLMVAYRRSQA